MRWFEQRLDRWSKDRLTHDEYAADYVFRHMVELGPAGKRFAPRLVGILRSDEVALGNFYLIPAIRELTR